MKKILLVISTLFISNVFADGIESSAQTVAPVSESSTVVVSTVAPSTTNPNASFINRYGYFQNPYNGMLTGGGTLHLTESEIEQQNWAEKLFAGGTYNVFSGFTYNQWDGYYQSAGKGYGSSVFGQTGQLWGFSVGGVFSAMNPIGALNDQINPIVPNSPVSSRFSSAYVPTFTSYTFPELFLEYQYNNVVNADVGYLDFSNSPWLAGNMYYNNMPVPTSYQGINVNVYAGGGWLLTALAFNAAEYGAQYGFTGVTNYSWLAQKPGYSNTSDGTVAIGAQYTDNSGNYNARAWGYQFDNYGTLLYGDGSINFPIIGSKNSFSVAAQFATDQQWFQASNAMTNAATDPGNIQSYAAGINLGWAYDLNLWQVNLSANTMWGTSNSWGGGAIASPYTQSLQVDPLYSEAWSYNMVTQGQPGNMYKLQAQYALGWWGQNLLFRPVYVYVDNNNIATNGLQELDLILEYAIPQVKGLNIFGAFAQQWYRTGANTDASLGSTVPNGNFQPIEIQTSLLYTW
ncbi:MAG: hypothetical protein EKK64_02275 [Neisseriaceae bacterium]|jgi:hypothetical protein|nr:MAG: hypothetical protein EKK64_02275 [Neisseriaceae bacterium]